MLSRELLPPNSTQLEQDLVTAIRDPELRGLPIRDFWRVDRLPEALLPYLAHTLNVTLWDNSWTVDQKRGAIKESIEASKIGGTIKAIKDIVSGLGFVVASVTEGVDGEWARYDVTVTTPLTADQGAQVRRLIEAVAPERCHLRNINFTEVSNRYDGSVLMDGSETHGAV